MSGQRHPSATVDVPLGVAAKDIVAVSLLGTYLRVSARDDTISAPHCTVPRSGTSASGRPWSDSTQIERGVDGHAGAVAERNPADQLFTTIIE